VKLPHESPLSCGHTSDRAEGSLNLEELSALCTNLSNRVLALETIKDAQAKEILTLKAKIKKLEKRCKPSISHHRAWLRSVSLLSKKKKLNDKAKGVAFKDSEDTNRPARSILTLKPLLTIDPKNKGKCVLEKPESAKKMTKSDFDAAQIARDEEITRQLEVELQSKEHELIVDFVPIGSEEDERRIRDMNKKAEDESSDKGVDNTKKRKARSMMKMMSRRQKTNLDLEEEEEKLKTFLKIVPD
nr:hypothetical protein [Tanacetum cinerariifolium]